MQYTDTGIRLDGFFRGKVIKHCSMGKCKVFVPGVYPATYATPKEADNLPDAEQITPLFGGSNKGNGVFSYPNLDSTVIVGFWNGDQNYPFFWGATLGGDQAGEQYTEAKCVKTEEAEETGDDARVHKITVDHTIVKMWESGRIEIKVFKDRKYNKGDEQPEVGCQIDIEQGGNVNIYSTNQIHLQSPELRIDTDKLTLNSGIIKVNNGKDIMVNTQNYRLTAYSQIESLTKAHTINADMEYHVKCPIVDIDAKDGSISMITKYHPPLIR